MSSYFALGGDLNVRRIGLGTMRLADGPEPPASPLEAEIWTAPHHRVAATELLQAAAEHVDMIDTADAYALGAGEELIAEALHPYRSGLVIGTKIGVARPGPFEWVPLGRPEYLRQQAELSLRRLRVAQIDLLYLHRIDPLVPMADQIGALKQLRDEGKVRHIGLSDVTVEQIQEAERIVPIASVQNLYNLADRQHDAVVDHTTERGIAFVPFFPLAMGTHADAVAGVAREIGATPAQTALAWLLHRAPNVLPIPGARQPRWLSENAAALDLKLTDEQYGRLSALDENER